MLHSLHIDVSCGVKIVISISGDVVVYVYEMTETRTKQYSRSKLLKEGQRQSMLSQEASLVQRQVSIRMSPPQRRPARLQHGSRPKNAETTKATQPRSLYLR